MPPRRYRAMRCRQAGLCLAGLLVVRLLVQRLARDLSSAGVEQLHLERVGAVVVGRDQREAVLDESALVDGEIGQLGGGDRAGGPQRAAVDEGDLCDTALLAAPGADHVV